MMFPHPSLLWLLAEARQKEEIKAAEKRAMVKWLRQQRTGEVRLWQRLSWQLGGWLVNFGHQLQRKCEAASACHYERSERPV
jgi:hypothetical protein